ncbi:MAG TPA: hypothetical protein VE685_15915 [Thermoanaerobaculia bacterium]|nr:hypothetical protein [Thermoanaerobaculia bacterium]
MRRNRLLNRGTALFLILLTALPGMLDANPVVVGVVVRSVVVRTVGKTLTTQFKAALTRGAGEAAGRWLVDWLRESSNGKTLDRQLQERQSEIDAGFARATPAERKVLEAELAALRKQRRIIQDALSRVPKREEIEQFQREVSADLQRLEEIVADHEKRIGKLEGDVADLRSRVEDIEGRLGPGATLADLDRFDEAARTADTELTTGLMLRFQIDPSDCFVRTWRRGDARGVVNGRAAEYDPRKKNTQTLYLPSDGEYLIYLIHDTLPTHRIKVNADSLEDPRTIQVVLGR